MKLTETAIRAAAKRALDGNTRIEVADPDLPGLRLRIASTGSASWVLGCRDTHGKARRFPVGQWPIMGVAQAREAARSLQSEVKKGADPIAEGRRKRSAAKHAGAGVGTLSALLELYGSQHGKGLRSWPECRKRIESVFAKHLSRALSAVTRLELQATADDWPSSQSAAAAVRYLRPVMKWAALRQQAPDQLALIVPPAKVGRRKRVLSREELAQLLPVLRASGRPYADALRFLLLTLARREEASAALWRDIDLQAAVWTIPRTKNDQPHAVPLSRQALELLRRRKAERAKPTDLVFANATGNPLLNWDRETKMLMKASATAAWTRHDLRRTGATMLGDIGEMPDIIEAALNHVAIRSQLAATYNRSRYRPQVATALQRLADVLDAIEFEDTEASQPPKAADSDTCLVHDVELEHDRVSPEASVDAPWMKSPGLNQDQEANPPTKRRKRQERIVTRVEDRTTEILDLLSELEKRTPEIVEDATRSEDPRSLTTTSVLACYYQRYVRSKKNPIHVWTAIKLCTDREDLQLPLPSWCLAYLQQVATAIVSVDSRLAMDTSQRASDDRFKKAADEAWRAFGISPGRGRNAFRDAASDRRKLGMTMAVDEFLVDGYAYEEAHKLAVARCRTVGTDRTTTLSAARKLSVSGNDQLGHIPEDFDE